MAQIDHLVLGARTLEDGAAFAEWILGAKCQPGGRHDGAGTHNLLLGLGPDVYLEVIAIDPDQPEPAHPRLFGLDDPAIHLMLDAEPRLLGWVARTTSLDATMTRLGPRAGEIREMQRGDLRWRMAIPSGRGDMATLVPALIEWKGERAGKRLKDSKLRVAALEAEYPDGARLNQALKERGLSDILKVRHGSHPRLVARLTSPDGKDRILSSA